MKAQSGTQRRRSLTKFIALRACSAAPAGRDFEQAAEPPQLLLYQCHPMCEVLVRQTGRLTVINR